MFDENENLLKILEKQGQDLLSNPNCIYQPRGQIDASTEQILSILHNIDKIESENIITGLLMNLSSFVSLESVDQVWKDLITACQNVHGYLDIFGIMETLRTLVVLGGSMDQIFLDYLIDPQIPYDIVRPYALETLYEYFPSDFFTSGNDRKLFFSELLINSFSTGDIYHRSFLLLILFALHLNVEQIISLTNLQTEFWGIIFDISAESDFSHLLTPARKLKVLVAPFFEQENPIIRQSLLNFHSSIANSEDFIPTMLNLFKIFYLFPTNDIIDFLRFSHDAFLKFTYENWTNIKSISQLLYEALEDARFTEGQVQEMFEFSGTLPETCSKYFIFVHFIDIFNEIGNFDDKFIISLCTNWVQSDAFNPVVYCFCISQVSIYLNPKDELFETVIYPSIFSFIEAEGNPLLNYEALKALNHFYRDDLIKAPDFCNSLLELTLKAKPQILKYFFKIILEIERHTRSNDDDDEEGTKKEVIISINKQIHQKLEDFTRSSFVIEDINPFLLSHLCDTIIYFITGNESDEFIQYCATVCQKLIAEPIYSEDPNVLSNVSSLVLNILRYANPEKLEPYFALFHPIYDNLMGLVSQINFAPQEGNEINPELHRVMGCVAFLLSHISKKSIKCETPYIFPLTIISNILDSMLIEVIKPGLNIARRQLPLYYTPEENPNRELFFAVVAKIVNHAETTNSFVVLNMCYKVFINLFDKFQQLELLEPLSQFIEQMKRIVFEERMKILNNQSIVKIKPSDDIHHFDFFEFLTKLIKINYKLTALEILTLIKWAENISENYYLDLSTTFLTIIRSGQLIQYVFLLKPLWDILNYMLKQQNSNFGENNKTVMGILYTISDFLTFTSNNRLGIFDCSNLYHSLQFFWTNDSRGRKKSINVLKLLGPIYLHVYSMTKSINDVNFSILNQIFDAMIDMRIKSWNYRQMITDIIIMYEKFTTLHLSKEVGADVLFTFYWNSEALDFPEDLTDKIRETLNIMQYRESIVDYLLRKYEKKPDIAIHIDEAFDKNDDGDY